MGWLNRNGLKIKLSLLTDEDTSLLAFALKVLDQAVWRSLVQVFSPVFCSSMSSVSLD